MDDLARLAPTIQEPASPGANAGGAPVPSEENDVGMIYLRDKADVAARTDTAFLEDLADLEEEAPETGRGFWSTAWNEGPKQVAGGVRDAAAAALEGVAAFDQWAGSKLGLPKLQLLDDAGNLDLKILSADEAGRAKVILPEVGEPETVAGGLVRGVSQFLTGFVAGSRVLGVGGKAVTTGGKVAQSSGAAAISDFAAFDAHEARLSDLVESYPDLANPITEYLASDMEDGELEGRLKNVSEGVLSDVALAGLVAGVRGIRQARRAKDGIGGETYAEAADRLSRDPAVGKEWVPEIRAARVSDVPLVAREIDEVGAETAAQSLTLSKVRAGEGDVWVNWGRIDSTDDVKSVIQQLADAGREEIDAAKRGVRSNAETALAAEKQNAWALLVERRKGEPLNAEQSLAMRQLWTASGEKLTEAARAVQENPSAENVFLFRRAVALHGTIQREVMAVRAETARALQQWKIPAGSNEMIARQIGETVDMFGGEGVADDLAAKITMLADAGEYGAIDNLTRKGALAASFDAVSEYWVNAILSGPKTHMVNAVSNAGVILLSQIERATAAGIGKLRGGTDRVEMGEAGEMLHGALAALPDAWRFAGRAFRSGQTGFGLSKLEAPRRRAWSTEALANTRNEAFNRVMNLPLISHGINAMGAVITVPGRALGTSDEFFKTINYRMEVHAQAARQAAQEIRDGTLTRDGLKRRVAELVAEPSERVSALAREFAGYNTFTNDAGRLARAAVDLRNKFPLLRFIVPFVNTPANIMRFAAERSPGAALLGDVRADLRAGGARADMAIARMGLGSVAMATAFTYAMDGRITGAGPARPTERAALMRSGWKPYSVKIGDRYFAYNRLDPAGSQFGVAATLAEMALNSDVDPGEDVEEAVFGAIGAIGQTMMDKTYLRGLAELFTAMSEPQMFVDNYLQNMQASFVPAILREGEAFGDPVVRRTSNTLERMRAKIPGLAEELPARHDLWGREISYQSGLGPVYDAVSPLYSSTWKPEPIDEEFGRIDYFPGLPSTTLTINHERFALKNEPVAYERYVVLQGGTPARALLPGVNGPDGLKASEARLWSYGSATLLETLNAIVTGQHEISAEYADADLVEKRSIVRRTMDDYRRAAREILISEFPEIFEPGSGRL